MKFKLLLLPLFYFISIMSYAQSEIIELPLTAKTGYGPFRAAAVGMSPDPDDENNPWSKINIKVKEGPKNLTEIKYGNIDTNYYQSAYQGYMVGDVTKEWYTSLQNSWNWTPDTLQLSSTPIKTKIAFAYGKDSEGNMKIVVDANNNLDLSDDAQISPFDIVNGQVLNDSLAQIYATNISFEVFRHNQVTPATVPLFIEYSHAFNMFLCNFCQYSTAQYKGVEIAVCPDRFVSLSYMNPGITLMPEGLKQQEKIKDEDMIQKNEYVKIDGETFKFLGVNTNKNVLILEKTDVPKEQLFSTQVGYKSYPFEGEDFKTSSIISSDSFRGKYVLLDFWAVWCAPCVQEFPGLKELYNKTDRSDFEIIGIVGDSKADLLNEAIDKHAISWPQILSDNTNKIKETFGVISYPTTILLDKDGFIVAKDLRGKALEEKVLSLIGL